MAHDLNLRSEWIDETSIRVSWIDTTLPEFNKSSRRSSELIAAAGFIFFMAVGFAVSMIWFLAAIAWIIGTVFLFKKTRLEPNQITFTNTITSHNGQKYNTQDISRFDYALRSHWTGEKPWSDGKGNHLADPTQLRMWLNDDGNHIISTNNWQPQVNHQIRNALDEALNAVRQKTSKIKHEEEHGKTGDFGVPEY